MMSEAVYARAVGELSDRTFGRLEDRDRIKVVQLFNRLLAEGHVIHVDDLCRLCEDAGYDESTVSHIGHLYDTLRLIRHELEDPRTIDYWRADVMDRILGQYEEAESREVQQ